MAAEPLRRSDPWYVEAMGRVWGPYDLARLKAFVDEGRVTPASQLADRPEGPFRPAAERPELDALCAPKAPAESALAARPLLVIAELKSLSAEQFERALGAYGETVRVRPEMWLIRARLAAPALRNALSRRLSGTDHLMVIEAPLEKAAWFNLDGDLDRRLRRVWGEG
jgi:hypothetical protein